MAASVFKGKETLDTLVRAKRSASNTPLLKILCSQADRFNEAMADQGQRIVIRLNISAEQYQRHYRGIPTVSATSMDGREVSLPAVALRAHVTREGVHGTFVFQISDTGKLLKLERLS